MFEVRITAPAEDDIQQNFTWWRDNRDADQAAEWYDSIYPAINSLSQMPRRCAFAREQDMYTGELRQLYFGIGRNLNKTKELLPSNNLSRERSFPFAFPAIQKRKKDLQQFVVSPCVAVSGGDRNRTCTSKGH